MLPFFPIRLWIFDPHSLEVTTLLPSPEKPVLYLVSYDNVELFVVAVTFPVVADYSRLTCRVSRLNEEAGQWVKVSDLGDRILFLGQSGNVSCSAKELPHGCGLSGNNILFITDNATFSYKYGVHS